MGGANVFASFFDCFPCAASLSRSSLQEKVGSKSQFSSLMSSGILIFVILFAGPLFYYLPKVSFEDLWSCYASVIPPRFVASPR